jgi:hypothetical protein
MTKYLVAVTFIVKAETRDEAEDIVFLALPEEFIDPDIESIDKIVRVRGEDE